MLFICQAYINTEHTLTLLLRIVMTRHNLC